MYMELPTEPEEYTVEHVERKVSCSICDNDLYEAEVEEEDYTLFFDNGGVVRGNSAGAWPIDDPGSLPRQLEEDGDIFICGYCNDVDTFERQGGTIFGIDSFGHHYGAFYVADTVIDSHYITDNNFDQSNLSDAFESIALNEEDITLNDGTEMVKYEKADKEEVIDQVEKGENPFDHTVIVSGYRVWIPKEENN